MDWSVGISSVGRKSSSFIGKSLFVEAGFVKFFVLDRPRLRTSSSASRLIYGICALAGCHPASGSCAQAGLQTNAKHQCSRNRFNAGPSCESVLRPVRCAIVA